MAWTSVCPSVRHTAVCVKTVQARITKFLGLLWVASRTLVFCDEILSPCVRGFTSNEGVKEGYSLALKRRCFAVIGSSSVKTIAGRYNHVANHNKHSSAHVLYSFINIDDLELPKLGGFIEVLAIFGSAHIFRVNGDEMAGNRPTQPM